MMKQGEQLEKFRKQNGIFKIFLLVFGLWGIITTSALITCSTKNSKLVIRSGELEKSLNASIQSAEYCLRSAEIFKKMFDECKERYDKDNQL